MTLEDLPVGTGKRRGCFVWVEDPEMSEIKFPPQNGGS